MPDVATADNASRVRLADPGDEEGLVTMVHTMHQELGFRNANDTPMAFAADKVRALIQRATVARPNDPSAVPAWIGVIGDGHQLEGSAYLTVREHWASDEPQLMELWNFVLPAFRKSTNAKALITFSKALALTLNLPLLMGVMSMESQPAKARLYERSTGCKPFGQFYLFNATAIGTV